MTNKSKKYRLNKEDLIKVGKGALIAIGAAFLTYFAEIIGQIDFGVWTPLAVAGSGIIINAGRKLLAGFEE
jgi:hypothetical protein